MPNIFEIYAIDQRLYDLVDQETGELLDEEAFAALQMEREAKVENLVLWYKNTLAESEAVKREADALTERSHVLRDRADGLKERIGAILAGEKFSTPLCKVSFRPSESVEIADIPKVIRWAEESGRDECLSYKPPTVLKTALKDMLLDGVDVPGAKIVKKRNVVIK